jgi:V/A-type H+-transporting ATPase subunit I
MSRVELVCLSSIRNELVANLQHRGLLHLEEVDVELEDAPDFLSRVVLDGEDGVRLAQYEDAVRTLNEVSPLLTIAPSAFDIQAASERVGALSETDLLEKIKEWAESVRETTRKRVETQDQLDVLQNYQTILEQISPALGSDTKLGKGTRALVLTGDVAKVAARIEERLEEEIGSCTFHKNQTTRKHLVGLISFPEDKEDQVGRILSQEGVSPVDMSDDAHSNATVNEVLERVKKTIADRRSELGAFEGEINTLSSQIGAEVAAAKTITQNTLAQLQAQGRMAQSEMLTVVNGWVPRAQYGELEKAVEADFPGQVEINELSHDDIPHGAVPTLLKNHKYFKPFEVVLSMFRPPTYGTIDPTWMVAVSFVLFYGFILGDAVYGLAIIGLAQYLRKKLGHIEAVDSAGIIGIYMGISSIFFGVIYGEYCGNLVELTIWPALFGHKLPIFFHREHESTQLLIYAIYMGIFHIFTGLALGIKEDFSHHHTSHALEKLGMLLGLLAIVVQAFAYFDQVLISPGFVSVFSLVSGVTGVILIFYAMGLMGLIGVLEIMSLGGNVLSYARLMALGIASIALAKIANDLPAMFGESLGFAGILIGIIGAFMVHVLNLGIGIASPTIHSLRLNFVEFLPKFYSPEGKGFDPFKKEIQS